MKRQPLTRPPRKRKNANVGRRIRVGTVGVHVRHEEYGMEGVLLEKTNNVAWPFHVLLDSGNDYHLDDWEFEYIEGVAPVPVHPVQPSKQDLTASEVKEEVMAKTSAKRVAVKGRKTTAKERVAPARGKATESTRKAAAAKPAKRTNKWREAIFDIVGDKRGTKFTQTDLNKHEAKLAKANPDNNNIRSTLRQTLQAMVRAGDIVRVEKDGEMVPGAYKVA